jgi:hypothetical protein
VYTTKFSTRVYTAVNLVHIVGSEHPRIFIVRSDVEDVCTLSYNVHLVPRYLGTAVGQHCVLNLVLERVDLHTFENFCGIEVYT